MTTTIQTPHCAHTNCTTPVIRLGSFYCSAHTEGDSRTTTTKEESIMNTLTDKAKDITGKVAPVKASLTEWVKATYTTVKESKVLAFTTKKAKALGSLLNKKKTVIAVASASVTVGGLVTSSVLPAIAVGAGVASLVVLAAAFMAKKKEEKLKKKALLADMALAIGITAILPFALFALAYAGLFATVYGAILPYSIIVA